MGRARASYEEIGLAHARHDGGDQAMKRLDGDDDSRRRGRRSLRRNHGGVAGAGNKERGNECPQRPKT